MDIIGKKIKEIEHKLKRGEIPSLPVLFAFLEYFF